MLASKNATGLINRVIFGKRYNRAVSSHKLMSDALHEIRLQAFLDSISEQAASKAKRLMADLQKAFPTPQYFEIFESNRLKEFLLTGTRKGNCNLHLASVRLMLPWMFAYDQFTG